MTTNATPAARQTCPVCTANRHAAALEMLNEHLCPSSGEQGLKLRVLAKRLGVNVGYLSQIVHGKRTPSVKVYRALGLPPPARVVEIGAGFDIAPVCAKCGSVHTTKRCTKGRVSRPRNKHFKWGGVRYVRHAGTDQI